MNALRLQEPAESSPVLSAGVRIDRLSWWFWIKAGIGFTIGASTIGVVAGIVGWFLMFALIGGASSVAHSVLR